MKKCLLCFWKALEKTIQHDGVEHAGYMSFLVLLSFFPFIVFFLALTSFLGTSELGSNFVDFMIQSLPSNATESIKHRVEELVKAPPASLMTLAIIGTIWTSSSFVEGMRTILNRVYHISTPPPYLMRRFMSIIQFIIINLVIYLVMFLLVIVPAALNKFPEIAVILGSYITTLNQFRYIFIWTLLFITVCIFYCILPNKKIKLIEVAPGAAVTMILWMISSHLLSNYLIYYRQFSLVYGSLGSIIVTMLFFYIISMLFIYGAELNYQLHHSDSKKNNP
ncbi:MAG: YihY/virulence factor BrkB family protein [Rickettsiaceae bacterium]|nr:YihY/virulence factor BrkB family protein [Rickettsiaceae bacterium]